MKWLVGSFLASVLLPFVPTRVIDGDTCVGLIELRPGLYEQQTIRIQCLSLPDAGYYNAPELRADGGGVAEAKRFQAFLSQPDASYLLLTNWKDDKYGRVLGEPGVRDGKGFCSWDGGTP